MLWMCVVVRVFVNPLSNVFQKLLTRRGMSPLVIVGVTHGLLTVICIPLLLIDSVPGSPAFWLNITVCAALAVAGNVLLVKAVQLSDLSILGPVNSYKAVISLIPGIVLLQEIPSTTALLGVALIVAGSYFIADRDGTKPGKKVFVRFFTDRGVQFRLAALVLSAVEAVFLKRALIASSPLATFAVWAVLCLIFVLPFAVRFDKVSEGVRSAWASNLNCLALAVTTGLMQFSTLIVFSGFQVAPALALFQTSTLVSVVLGWHVFGEEKIAQRLLGSSIMVVGAILIVATRPS
jgi:drug/metabolite transporter (DMT)-like permease